MKKEQFKKKRYVSPSIEVIHNPFEGQPLLNAFSNSGGHNKVGDDEEMNAKQGFFDEDEEEEETPQRWGI